MKIKEEKLATDRQFLFFVTMCCLAYGVVVDG